MNKDKIKIFDTQQQLAESFAKYFSEQVIASEKFNIAVSGGSTPKIIFQTLAENYKDIIDWNKVNFYWGDERCVPPDSEESNYRMTKEILFDNINIPSSNIHRIIGENNPKIEAVRYSNLLKNNIPLVNEFPQFDFVMLGLGEDGHTASIFPDRLDLFETDKICDAVVNPVTLQNRITITGNVINNSKSAAFFVTGKGKSPILKSILNDKLNYFPASLVKISNNNLEWYLDKDATSEI